MRCYRLFDDLCRVDDEGENPWRRTHGRDFKGKMVPFGSKVFLSSPRLTERGSISSRIQLLLACSQGLR